MLDTELVLEMFSDDILTVISRLKEFNEAENEDKALDGELSKRIMDDEAKVEVLKLATLEELAHIKSLQKDKRDEILRKIKGIDGLTQRQAARILGGSPNLIFRA